MNTLKPSKLFASALLTLSLLPTGSAFALTPQEIALRLQKLSQNSNISPAEMLLLKTQAVQYFTSILSIKASDLSDVKQINPLIIKDLSQQDTNIQEKRILVLWAQMINAGTLQSNIAKLLEEIKASPTPLAEIVKKTPPAQIEYAINALRSSIEATVRVRGLTNDSSAKNHYNEWSTLSKFMSAKVDKSDPTNPLDLADSQWIKTESAEVLVNGPASFAKRDQFMRDATTSINILTWSIYDDVTGTETVDILLKKKKENPGLKIRVMVDGQVAATSGHGVQVKRLEAAGIEVIRWTSKDFAYMGQHRKMLIIDNEHLIAGGLNFGDVYSHKNPDLKIPRWRDTDIYIKGAGAEEGNRLFAKLWNDQIREHGLKYKQISFAPKSSNTSATGIEISLINSDPRTTNRGSTVMLTILKAIREAKQQIDIENAYIILFPALKNEISAAIKRGVHVRVFTNSSESVDEPVVSIPILRSVTEFITMGAEVYVKKGATLHSKLVVVDSDLTLIMSYNLHPRSERVEGEMAVAVRDVNFAQNMHKVFDNDVTADKATSLKEAKDVKMPNSPVSVPTLRLFFDML